MVFSAHADITGVTFLKDNLHRRRDSLNIETVSR